MNVIQTSNFGKLQIISVGLVFGVDDNDVCGSFRSIKNVRPSIKSSQTTDPFNSIYEKYKK